MKKIYPLKIFNRIFFSLFLLNICITLVIHRINPDLSVYFFWIGMGVVVISALPNFLFYGIFVSEVELIISSFGLKGHKKHKILLKDIVGLNIKKGQSYFGVRRHYFIVNYLAGNEAFQIVINEERYCIRHLKYLFQHLSEKSLYKDSFTPH